MAKQYPALTDQLTTFITEQKMFFVATAADNGRVNISPKGMDSLQVLNNNRLVWLNLTGSGNETSAHILRNNRMTIMFCAFSGSPLILRLYGRAREITPEDREWDSLSALFPPLPGARQIFDLSIDLVQSSCGFAVPLYEYTDDRDLLENWAAKKGQQGIKQYWQDKNLDSIDGFETRIKK